MFVIDEVWFAHSPLGGLLEHFFGIAPVATEIKKGLISFKSKTINGVANVQAYSWWAICEPL